MDKPEKTREERRRDMRYCSIFVACIVLGVSLEGWINTVLGWFGR